MAKDPYKNARYYLDKSIAATRKLLKDPYGGRQTGPRAKDMSQNEDKGSRMAKIGVGDISPSSWLRGGGANNPFNFHPNPATQNSNKESR